MAGYTWSDKSNVGAGWGPPNIAGAMRAAALNRQDSMRGVSQLGSMLGGGVGGAIAGGRAGKAGQTSPMGGQDNMWKGMFTGMGEAVNPDVKQTNDMAKAVDTMVKALGTNVPKGEGAEPIQAKFWGQLGVGSEDEWKGLSSRDKVAAGKGLMEAMVMRDLKQKLAAPKREAQQAQQEAEAWQRVLSGQQQAPALTPQGAALPRPPGAANRDLRSALANEPALMRSSEGRKMAMDALRPSSGWGGLQPGQTVQYPDGRIGYATSPNSVQLEAALREMGYPAGSKVVNDGGVIQVIGPDGRLLKVMTQGSSQWDVLGRILPRPGGAAPEQSPEAEPVLEYDPDQGAWR